MTDVFKITTSGTAPSLGATLEFLDQAADRLTEAGADDPGDNYTFGLVETDTAAQDLDLAVALIRRAQDRLREWEGDDLRALAVRMILEKGVGYCDVEDTDDDFQRMAEEEFPENNALQPLHFEAVRDMMRRSVIEIDGVRFNDEDTQKASHGITLDHVGGRLKQPQGPHGPA